MPDGSKVEQWPFPNSVDVARDPAKYGLGKCGDVKGVVMTLANEPVSFVQFDIASGMLILNPAQKTYPATYNLVVRFWMERYPSRNTAEPFVAIVEPCVTVIKTNGAQLADYQTGWGEEAVIVSIAPALRMVTLEPNCGYPVSVKPVVSVNGAAPRPIPIPHSVEYSAAAMMMRVGKCSSATFSADPDCA